MDWLKDRAYDLNLLFGFSMDWYQQYSGGLPYSIGVIYLVILNLPRDIRLLKSNIMVVGQYITYVPPYTASITRFYSR